MTLQDRDIRRRRWPLGRGWCRGHRRHHGACLDRCDWAAYAADHPECAESLVRHHICRARDAGISEREIRRRLRWMQDDGLLDDVDVDDLLCNEG